MTTNTLTATEEQVATLRRLKQDARNLAEALRPFDGSFGLWGPYHHALNMLRAIRDLIGEMDRSRP